MREWLLLGVVAVGGLLFLWLLFFRSLALLYEWWVSGREFEKLKREAASRRRDLPSDLMRKKLSAVLDDESDGPVIPQGMLDSLTDDEADPRLVPQKVEPKSASETVEATPVADTLPVESPAAETAAASEEEIAKSCEPIAPVQQPPAPQPPAHSKQPEPTPEPKPTTDESTTTTASAPASFPLPPLGGNPLPPTTSGGDTAPQSSEDQSGQPPRHDDFQ